ncbi:MAG TPA: hypothetical protein PKH65_05560 [Bacteroidia bacterium]|nr:hypothetical protein [Bacteroidia bacterium]HNT80129.1 hypothetical protein [Bacteroidia bacterium]
MKKIYASFLLLFFLSGNIQGQGFINSLSLSPINPSSNDSVILIADIFTSYSSCGIANATVNVSGNNITVDVCYWHGMLAALCPRIDQFNLGILPSGSYMLTFNMFTSSDLNCSTPMSAASSSIAFSVSTTSVSDLLSNEVSWIHNVNGNTIFNSKNTFGEFVIYDAIGRKIFNKKIGENQSIGLKSIVTDKGYYIISYQAQGYKNLLTIPFVIF